MTNSRAFINSWVCQVDINKKKTQVDDQLTQNLGRVTVGLTKIVTRKVILSAFKMFLYAITDKVQQSHNTSGITSTEMVTKEIMSNISGW